MKAMEKRLRALEGHGEYLTLGEMIDSLDGAPPPEGKKVDPAIVAGIDGLPAWKPYRD